MSGCRDMSGWSSGSDSGDCRRERVDSGYTCRLALGTTAQGSSVPGAGDRTGAGDSLYVGGSTDVLERLQRRCPVFSHLWKDV